MKLLTIILSLSSFALSHAYLTAGSSDRETIPPTKNDQNERKQILSSFAQGNPEAGSAKLEALLRKQDPHWENRLLLVKDMAFMARTLFEQGHGKQANQYAKKTLLEIAKLKQQAAQVDSAEFYHDCLRLEAYLHHTVLFDPQKAKTIYTELLQRKPSDTKARERIKQLSQ